MKMEHMEGVYLRIFSIDCRDTVVAPIETVIILFTMRYCNSRLKIKLIMTTNPGKIHGYPIDIEYFNYCIVIRDDISDNVKTCLLPNLILDDSSRIAGMCACLRQIVKSSININSSVNYRSLLGFKESCLSSCSESSIWTKFCEVDLITTLNTFNIKPYEDIFISWELPIDMMRYEVHMSQPIRLHNIYKYSMSKKYSKTGIVTHDRNAIPEHLYAEGSEMNLADIIIFVCIHNILNLLSREHVLKLLPLTAKWYDRMLHDNDIIKSMLCIAALDYYKRINKGYNINYKLPTIVNQSLYKSDVKRYRPRSQIYTRQENIDNSLKIIDDMKLNLISIDEQWENELNFDWSKIPYDATPEGGSLPSTRSNRKYQQLTSLCNPVLKLAKDNNIIVDFCSGSGHLGILIAYLLPNCTIILLENKEESLNRAKERVKKLNLNNIKFYQCNIDYFNGNFHIGVSLHACGVATDLVIRHCILRNATFICCPCCYGSVKDCHHINYPRSKIYKNAIDIRDYLVLGHAADQTHDEKNSKTKQGYKCMNIIDTDRKYHAEENNYKVHLTKLIPETCTPKNNLLIGIPI